MTPQQHALLARRLIKGCGGLEEASVALDGRLKKSRLAEFQDPKSGAFMTIDVVADLEQYCGEPIYSAAVAAERPAEAQAKNVLTEACEATEAASALQRIARMAAEDGRLSEAEKLALEAGAQAIEDQLRELRSAMHRSGAQA